MKGFVSTIVPKATASVRCGSVISRASLTGVAFKGSCQLHTAANRMEGISQGEVWPRESFIAHSFGKFASINNYAANSVESVSLNAPFPAEITWLVGAPGSGKGTNSAFVSNFRGYSSPVIVMSSLLENPECRRIKDAGGMVDDQTVFSVLLAELRKPEYQNGVVIDGFPRTEKQATWLKELAGKLRNRTKFSFVMLYVDEKESVSRQVARGENTRILNMLRRQSGLPTFEERATDTCEQAALRRYQIFADQLEAVVKLGHDFPLSVVDASAPIETVRERIKYELSPKKSTISSFFAYITSGLKKAAYATA